MHHVGRLSHSVGERRPDAMSTRMTGLPVLYRYLYKSRSKRGCTIVKRLYDSMVILPTHVGEDMPLFLIVGDSFVAIFSFSSEL